MAATSADATTETAALPSVSISTAVVEATTALLATPTVKVTSDAEWEVDLATAEATPPPPPPSAEPEPAPQRPGAAASRAGERTELPSTDAAPAVGAGAVEAPVASGSAIVDYARQFLGVPYVWGGTTPAGFDCSGFTSYVFAQFGTSLPRTSGAQASTGTRVSAAEARPGDLVTWPGHVGIYTGNGNNIAARQPGTPLTEGPIFHSSPVFIRVS
ncbi:C40 family peptidase [Georgenia soli]|nr:C40 family peptidase [Georgenia soli]